MSTKYIVVFEDGMGICVPMALDKDCAGALVGMTGSDPIALFDSRSDARKAIRISTAYAKLCAAQGLPANEDFLTCPKSVRVVPCAAASAPQIGGPT